MVSQTCCAYFLHEYLVLSACSNHSVLLTIELFAPCQVLRYRYFSLYERNPEYRPPPCLLPCRPTCLVSSHSPARKYQICKKAKVEVCHLSHGLIFLSLFELSLVLYINHPIGLVLVSYSFDCHIDALSCSCVQAWATSSASASVVSF